MLVVVVVGKVVSLWIKRRALQYAFREFPGPKPEFLRGNTREVRGRFLTSQHPLLSNRSLLTVMLQLILSNLTYSAVCMLYECPSY